MAYLDEQAQSRELMRQQLLSGKNPFNLPGLDPRVEQMGLFRMAAPQGVKVDPPQGIQLPQYPRSRPGTASPSPQPQDNSLGGLLDGILGKGSALDQYLKRLQASQQPPRAPGTPPQQLIPGLQPPIDASKAPPGTPAARAYLEQNKTGPAVRGVERPAQGPAESTVLADQRKDYAAQLDGNPATKEKLAAIMLAEEGGDSTARTALGETVFNRGISRNVGTVDAVLDPRYYAPFQDGGYNKALSRIRNDPQLRAQIYSEIDRVGKAGSNVSNLATDNASGAVAARAKTNSTHTFTGANGETFTRKDVRPDVHGTQAVKATKDWHANTSAALAEPSGPATRVASTDASAPQGAAPASEPSWLNKETLGTYEPAAQPPPGQPPPQAPQPPPQAPPPAPAQTQPPAPAAAPPPAPAAAPTPPAPAARAAPAVNPAHQFLDMKTTDFANRIAPGGGAQVPGMVRNMTVREVLNHPLYGGMAKGQMGQALDKVGVTPKQFDDALKEGAPPAPGKRSEGTSDATDFSARARTTEPGGAPAPVYGEPTEKATLDPAGQPAVQDAEGNISTVRTMGTNMDGKEVNVPTVSPDGRIMTDDQARQQYRDTGKHLGKYDTVEQAGAAAEALHQDEARSISQAPQGQQPSMTPEMAKAFVDSMKSQERAPGMAPTPADALPVMPSQVAPPAPGAPGGPVTSLGGIGSQPGGSSMPMTPGSQGGGIAMAGLAPLPVQGGPLTTPLSEGASAGTTVSPFQMWQPPIDFNTLQGFGWGGGGGAGYSAGGGFDFGGGGGGALGSLGSFGFFGGG